MIFWHVILMVAEITTLWYNYWMDISVFISCCHSNIKKVQLTCMATWLPYKPACDDNVVQLLDGYKCIHFMLPF